MMSSSALAATLLCLISVLSAAQSQVETVSEEVRLMEHLLENYTTTARPVRNDSTVVNVTLDIAFNQLLELDQQEQVMTASIYLRVYWVDEYLRWDESEFNVNSIVLHPDNLWLFDIRLYNSAHDDVNSLPVDKPIIVNSSGHVRFLQPVVIKSPCRLRSLYFPYDVQSCRLRFGSWVYSVGEVDVYPYRPTGSVVHFVDDGVWRLEEIPVKRAVLGSPCCPGEAFPAIDYYIILRRNHLYYVVNLFFPCFIITFLHLMVFYLPCGSTEKISFAVTMLLSLTVFMLVVTEYLPQSSENGPIISQYFTGAITLLGLNVFATVLTLQVYHRGDFGVPPPKWLKRLAFKHLARFMCLSFFSRKNLKKNIERSALDARRVSAAFREIYNRSQFVSSTSSGTINSQGRNDQDQTPPPSTDTESPLGLEYALLSTLMKEQVKRGISRDAIQEEWSKIAAVLDRVLLVIFFLGSVALHVYPFARYYVERNNSTVIESPE